MGKKVQFHRKVEKSIQKAKRIKPFHRELTKTETIICLRNSSNSRDRENSKGNFAESSSEQEHKVNALAQGADEGRDKLR